MEYKRCNQPGRQRQQPLFPPLILFGHGSHCAEPVSSPFVIGPFYLRKDYADRRAVWPQTVDSLTVLFSPEIRSRLAFRRRSAFEHHNSFGVEIPGRYLVPCQSTPATEPVSTYPPPISFNGT